MRYAIISDIHANYQSWQRILEDLDETGAEALICLGDIVGYGPMPQAVLDGVRSLASGVVLGNHDAAVCGRMDASVFNDNARKVVEWTRKHLDAKGIAFLKNLPLAIEYEDLLFVHAEAVEPARFDYIRDPVQAAANLAACPHRVVFYGHTHHAIVFAQDGEVIHEQPPADFVLADDRRYVINVGTAGEPRDPADHRAKYVIFDSGAGSVQFRSVDFDAEAYRAEFRREGLNIEPFFLRALDFAKGKYTVGSLRKEQAMTRLPVIPENTTPAAPRRLVVTAAPLSGNSQAILPLAAARRAGTLSRHAPPPGKSKANIALALTAVFLLAALVPVAWIAYQKHVAPPGSDRFSVAYEPPKEKAKTAPSRTSPVAAAPAKRPAPPAKPPAPTLPPLETDLLSYWSADTGNQARGSLQPTATPQKKLQIVRGRFDKAFAFGAPDGLSIGDETDYAIDKRGLTISFWIEIINPDDKQRLLLGTRTGAESAAPGWAIYAIRGGLGAIVSSGTSTRQLIYLRFPVEPKGFHHIAFVVDPAGGSMRLYHNGKLAEEGTHGSVRGTIPSSHPLALGFDPASGQNGSAGKIDDLAIWRRPLAPQEIGQIFQGNSKRKNPLSALLDK